MMRYRGVVLFPAGAKDNRKERRMHLIVAAKLKTVQKGGLIEVSRTITQ